MFKQIFRTAISELFNGVLPTELIEPAHDMIKIMVEAEKRWTKYITNVNGDWCNEISDVDIDLRRATLKGFSNEVIDIFIEGQANSVCSNLGLPLLYPERKNVNNPLANLLARHITYAREGVFETKGVEYSRNTNVGF